MIETIQQEIAPLNTNKPEPSTSKTLRSRKVVDLVFQNITYQIKSRVILNNISGICPGGHVTAIMGSSGAGKTTLLNVLACRISNSKTNKLTGQLLANSSPYDYEKFSKFASYVMQNDVLMETMTPKEALEFAANLKYSDNQVKESRVIETLKCMRLERCQNTYIGGINMKGISGGERKRTSIGYELVSNPSCILLDEPTSGLDSFTAFQIIHQLRKLSDEQDRTIIFTIHQPSSDIAQSKFIWLFKNYKYEFQIKYIHFYNLHYKFFYFSSLFQHQINFIFIKINLKINIKLNLFFKVIQNYQDANYQQQLCLIHVNVLIL